MILPRHHLEHCPSTQIYHDSSYLAENYAMAAISVVAFAARYCVRLRILPIRNLQGDDWMGIAVLLFFLYLTCCRLVVYHLGSNTDYNVTEIGKLSDCQIERLVFGSKFQVSHLDNHTQSSLVDLSLDQRLVCLRLLPLGAESHGHFPVQPATVL